MSKRQQQHQQRHQGLSMFGKELTRRSGACCELCEASGVPLTVFEVPPAPVEPEIGHCVFLCETCREQIDHPKRRDPDHWRCLGRAIWSQEAAIQALAVTLLRQLASDWSAELLEQLDLDPAVAQWVDKMEL